MCVLLWVEGSGVWRDLCAEVDGRGFARSGLKIENKARFTQTVLGYDATRGVWVLKLHSGVFEVLGVKENRHFRPSVHWGARDKTRPRALFPPTKRRVAAPPKPTQRRAPPLRRPINRICVRVQHLRRRPKQHHREEEHDAVPWGDGGVMGG